MKFKISLLAALSVVAFPLAAKAQDINSYESLKVSCESGAECSDFGIDFQEEGNKVAQTRRTRTRRTRSSSNDSRIYVGGGIAPFIPFDGELDLGFGGGIFAGYKLTENISVELDVFDYFGGLDDDEFIDGDDSGYNTFGAAVNGVYRYYLQPNDSRSVYIFAGVGAGVGVASLTGDLSDDLDDAGEDTSQVGFLVQGKGGVGYPLSDRIDLFGQTRFFSTFLDDDDSPFGGDDLDGVAIDVGATFNF